MALHWLAADATASFGVAFPWAAFAIMVGRMLVVKISPSAALAAPGYPTFVVHCWEEASSASLFAGFDPNGSLFSQPGNAAAAPVWGKAGKSYSSELYTELCAAPTRSSRNCLTLSALAGHLGTQLLRDTLWVAIPFPVGPLSAGTKKMSSATLALVVC